MGQNATNHKATNSHVLIERKKKISGIAGNNNGESLFLFYTHVTWIWQHQIC